jgi:hypothetical protein
MMYINRGIRPRTNLGDKGEAMLYTVHCTLYTVN